MTTTRPSFASIREPLWQNLLERGGLSSSPWSGTRIEARHAGWLLVLDSYRVPVESFDHTRMTVALPSLGFRFRVHEPDAFSWIGTIFGLLDIEIGEELFDQNWLIRSNSPTKIRELLSDPSLRDQIDAMEHVSLSLEADQSRPEPDRDDAEPPLRWDEVVLVRAELQTRTSDLRAMFDLVATTLERLEALAPSWAES